MLRRPSTRVDVFRGPKVPNLLGTTAMAQRSDRWKGHHSAPMYSISDAASGAGPLTGFSALRAGRADAVGEH